MTGQESVIRTVLLERIARNLRVAQAAATISNLELATAVGVSPRTVGKWRSGEIEITIGSLAAVADALSREVEWFLADHEPQAAAA